MNKIFQIGHFCFRLQTSDDLPFSSHFLLFEIQQGILEYTYHFHLVEQLPIPEGQVIAERADLIVYQTILGENRLLGIKGQDHFYASYLERTDKQADIYFVRKDIDHLLVDTVFTSMFVLERRMIEKDSLILHCAYINFHGQAILFSAPSGTGKSTQAELWERYRGSITVNGDRALLQKCDGVWEASGWPVCGSSEICHLGQLPICAIVMLDQGPANVIERLSPFQSFVQLYAQVTINSWNEDFVQRAIALIEDLIAQVPVYHLTCNISEDAVHCLASTLFPEGESNR